MEARKFKNFTNEDFSWKWDGVVYTFKAGQEIYLPGDQAEHFANHLVDREINKLNVEKQLHRMPGELSTRTPATRAPLFTQCFPSDESVTPLQALNLNEEVKEKKGKKKEVEFEDLNVKPRKNV